jgi:hypothetical protein
MEARIRRTASLCRTLVATHGWCRSCLLKVAESDLPNLWKPRPDQFFHIDAFPYPGTGKLDLRKAREIAVTKASAPP